ncbi:MAG TPA: DNA-processing protein DprA [Nitratidesulfovibrio sp.]|nr:DNA-processing protein DprA [Nitratidesulfovibrio sp.]
MEYSHNVLNVLTAKSFKGIGRAWITKNLKGGEDVEKIVLMLNRDAKEDSFITISRFEDRKKIVEDGLWKVETAMDGIVAVGDSNFPKSRGMVKGGEQPIVLFYRGNLELLESKNRNIAVVGLLNPDDAIEGVERNIVLRLVECGITIVSGLALGCDSIAHRQALCSDGNTIAILPSSLDKILPTTNVDLAQEIVEKNGLLVTEYYTNAKSKSELSSRYQERDRLQALFSDAIILVASYSKDDVGMDSGSRLAMEYAAKYSVPRAVLYDEIINAHDSMYNLNRQLVFADKEIMKINPDNMHSALKILMSRKRTSINNQEWQRTLFD